MWYNRRHGKKTLTKKPSVPNKAPITTDKTKNPEKVEELFDLSKTADIIRMIKLYKDDDNQIKSHFKEDLSNILAKDPLSKNYRVIFLYDCLGSIMDYDLSRIYDSLLDLEKGKEDILIIVHSNGGSIEPAYLISKYCKELGKKFVVVVPRKAKSVATLLSLGAGEIHMGPISQLGPIDPQIGGRPALGLGNALEHLAKLVTKYPKSSEMFAKFLNFELDLKQLGYFERVSESAVQYGERLLASKNCLIIERQTVLRLNLPMNLKTTALSLIGRKQKNISAIV